MNRIDPWPFGPRPIAANVEIALWSASVSLLEPWSKAAHLALGPAERIRRESYSFPADQERFVLGRFLLRIALAAWPRFEGITDALIEQASEINFEDIPGRAPQIRSDSRVNPASSLSRSAERLIVGIGQVHNLGVDIEENDCAKVFNPTMLETYFSVEERARFAVAAPHERGHSLLASWTGKEALVKATGLGMRVPLDEIILDHERIVALPRCFLAAPQYRLKVIREHNATIAVAWSQAPL